MAIYNVSANSTLPSQHIILPSIPEAHQTSQHYILNSQQSKSDTLETHLSICDINHHFCGMSGTITKTCFYKGSVTHFCLTCLHPAFL